MLESADFDRPLQIEISELTATTVTLVTNQRLLERTLHQAALLIDNTWFLSLLKDALEQQKAASLIEQVLFGIRASRESIPTHLVDVNLEAILHGVFTPDEPQRRAIEQSLRDELLLVIGPPGTGKTDVLAAIALAHLLRSSAPRILVLSHTNIALDNAIARLIPFCQRAGKQAEINARQIIRVGTPRLEELSSEAYRSVVLPLIIEDESLSIRLEITRIERKRDQLRTQFAANRQREQRLARTWGKERDQLSGQIETTGLQLVDLQRRAENDLAGQRQAVTTYEQQRDTAEIQAEQVRQGVRMATTQREQAEQRVLRQHATVQIWEQRQAAWQQKQRKNVRYIRRTILR